MKKLFSIFILLFFSIQGFSQVEFYFIDPKTNKNISNFINVNVVYGTPTKITLKLIFKGNMSQSDSYSWTIYDNNDSNSNITKITNSNGIFTSFSPWSKDITFTIDNNNEKIKSTKQLTYSYRGLYSGSTFKNENFTLYINVNNLPKSGGESNPGGENPSTPKCDDKRNYYVRNQTLDNKIMDHSIPNAFYESVIVKNSKISARKVTFKESHIYPNTVISVKGCTENNKSINFESKINKNLLTISPNPTFGQVQIYGDTGINDWYVYNINTRVVLQGNNKNENSLQVNFNSLPAGIYYFKFIDSSGSLHEKSIIKK